jgi:hypothetical protein
MKIYTIIDRLPLPRDLRLRLLQTYIDSVYRKKMRDAQRAKAPGEAIESIHDDWMVEDAFIADEQDLRFTRKSLRLAKRLRVPYPDDSDCWEETRTTGERILSAKGTEQLRMALREEQRWRQERRAHWIAYIAALTGVIGAVSGLIAVIAKAKGQGG